MARILIADDAIAMQKLLNKILKKAGHSIVGTAINGEETFLKIKELNPDIVIFDLVMPETDGLECIKSFVEKYPDVKIIVCSASGQRRFIHDSIKFGAIDFVVKPFDSEEILGAIDKALK